MNTKQAFQHDRTLTGQSIKQPNNLKKMERPTRQRILIKS